MLDMILNKGIPIICLFVAIILHEIAHGYAALKCGDPTARDAGRLSPNPIKHIDPFGSIILPALLVVSGSKVLFGWAKPVPINLVRTRNPRSALWITGLAGPVANMLQALVALVLSAVIWRWMIFKYAGVVYPSGMVPMGLRLGQFIVLNVLPQYFLINIMLLTFNMIPIPPLDGSRVITAFLPDKAVMSLFQLERFGFIIIYLLLYLNVLDIVISPILNGSMKLFEFAIGG